MILAGPIIVSLSLIGGGVLGAILGRWVPERVKYSLSMLFGVVTLGIGVFLICDVHSLHAVVLAMIVGTALGEIFYVERRLERGIVACMKYIQRGVHKMDETYLVQFITLISISCFSTMGLFGSISEGITRQPDILLIKAILDGSTMIIFGASMGIRVCLIAIPQFIIMAALYFCAGLIMPLMTDAVLLDFCAVGGIVLLATGFRMCEMKSFSIINMLPSLIVVIPFSLLWTRFMG